MRQQEINRESIRQEIKNRIQVEFPGSLVIHFGTGSPGDDYNDDTEQFEALMVEDEDFKRFVLFTAKLEEELAEPNGFFINVDSINPELTMKYRREEYENEIRKRESGKKQNYQTVALQNRVNSTWDENGKNGESMKGCFIGARLSAGTFGKVA